MGQRISYSPNNWNWKQTDWEKSGNNMKKNDRFGSHFQILDEKNIGKPQFQALNRAGVGHRPQELREARALATVVVAHGMGLFQNNPKHFRRSSESSVFNG